MAKKRKLPSIPDGGVWTVTSREQWDIIVYERMGQSIEDFLVRSGPMELDYFTLGPRPDNVDDIMMSDFQYAGLVFPGGFMKTEVLKGGDPDGGGVAVGGTVRLNFDRAGMTEWMQETYGKRAPKLTFEDAETADEDDEKPTKAPAFKVMVVENSHYGDDGYLSGTFDSAEEAVAHARGIVDEFFEGMGGRTEEELLEQYIHFGDNAYIPGHKFSARKYARARCAELGVDAAKTPEEVVEAPPPIEELTSLDAVRRRMHESRPANQTPEESEAWDAMVGAWEQRAGIDQDAPVEVDRPKGWGWAARDAMFEDLAEKKHADEDPGDDADQDALTASLLEVLEDAVGLARMPHEPIHWSFEEFKEGVIEDIQSVIESIRVGNDPLMEKADGVFRFGLQGLAKKSGSEDLLEKLAARYDEVMVLLAKRDAGSA